MYGPTWSNNLSVTSGKSHSPEFVPTFETTNSRTKLSLTGEYATSMYMPSPTTESDVALCSSGVQLCALSFQMNITQL